MTLMPWVNLLTVWFLAQGLCGEGLYPGASNDSLLKWLFEVSPADH